MFSNAQNLLMQDMAIHNAGRDITIINHYMYAEPESVRAHFPYVMCSDDLGGLCSLLQKLHLNGLIYFW